MLIRRDADAVIANRGVAKSRSASTATSIGRPAPNRIALDRRFRQICSTRSRSHEPVPPVVQTRQLAPGDSQFGVESVDDVAHHVARFIGSGCRSIRPVDRRDTSSRRSSVSSSRCRRCSMPRSCDCTQSTDTGSPAAASCSGLVDGQPDLKHQRRDRVAQFVRHRRDEFIAGADGVLQFLQPRPHRRQRCAVASSVGTVSVRESPSPLHRPRLWPCAASRRARRRRDAGQHRGAAAGRRLDFQRAADGGGAFPHAGQADHCFARQHRVESRRHRLRRRARGFAALLEQHVHRARARMLGDVVQGLLRDPIDAGLHFGGETLADCRRAWKTAGTPAWRDHSWT